MRRALKPKIEYFFTTPDFDLITVNRGEGETINTTLLCSAGMKVNGPYKTKIGCVRAALAILNEKFNKVYRWKNRRKS